jgi:hypothetical protein
MPVQFIASQIHPLCSAALNTRQRCHPQSLLVENEPSNADGSPEAVLDSDQPVISKESQDQLDGPGASVLNVKESTAAPAKRGFLPAGSSNQTNAFIPD